MTKYAYMNGLPGCMPDYHSGYCYDSEEKAVEAASDALELNEEEAKELLRDGILYIHGERYHEIGAGVIEIVETSDPDEFDNGGEF